MWYTYIILCEDGSLYTGATSDLDRRYQDHKNGKGGKFTKDRKVEKLLYFEKFGTEREALKRERQIKGWRREKKLNIIKISNL